MSTSVQAIQTCSFCGAEQSASTPLIAGRDGFICEACVLCAHRVVSAWGSRRKNKQERGSVPSPRQLKKDLDEYIIGQEQAKRVLAVAVYNHYQRLDAQLAGQLPQGHESVEVEKSNVLLFGPTGSGKTLLAKMLAKLVGVPFAVADATTLTQAGYVGEDVDTIIHRLLDAADGDVQRAEWGIVYIDEIDKIARRSQGSTGVRDISGEGVQQALLKLVEGHRVTINKPKNKDPETRDYLDTSNILFIAGGAFEGLLDNVKRRLAPDKRIGFGSKSEKSKSTDEELAALLPNVENQDFKSFGFIPEFIGRFPVLAGLEPLDEEALIRILQEPKNALTRQYQFLFAQSAALLEFSPEGLSAIARRAMASKTGARGLRAEIENALMATMFELPFENKSTRCTLTATGEDDELFVHTETAPSTTEETYRAEGAGE